ncbi:MAG TPA: PAS domain S-box protein [Nitrospiria bacterium]|nr:PAS domain S-box protein [Nitrospiria bacterium]
MVTPLRLLLINDSEQEAQFIVDMLSGHGLTVTYERVDTWAGIEQTLHDSTWDLVISNSTTRQLTALSVLLHLREMGLDLPFIILTDAIGETLAAEAIKSGTHAYIAKGDLVRLIPTIESVLCARTSHRERNRIRIGPPQQEKYFQSLIENSSDVITVVDLMGTILYDSPSVERVLGYRQGQLAGDSVVNYIHPEDIPRVTTILKNGIKEIGKSHVVEFRFRRIDGLWCLLESLGRGYRVDGGSIVGIFNSRDVTARRQTEERLKQAISRLTEREQELLRALEALKHSHEALTSTQLQLFQAAKLESVGRLAAGVAHEVRNPLAVISMGTQYLAKRVTTTDDKIQEVLHDIDVAIKRADSIIIGLLDFSSLQAINPVLLDVNSVVEQALMLLKYELDRHHITVSRSLGSSLPPLKLDKQKIEQALINLFLNAIQAMPNGGALTVTTSVVPAEQSVLPLGPDVMKRFAAGESVVLVEIEDTGSGIPEADLPRIYEPFFTGQPAGKGTGLGLTVTRNLIDMHKGMIHIQNRESRGVKVAIALGIHEEKSHGEKKSDFNC